MTFSTPPLLYHNPTMEAGDFIVLDAYQGVRFSLDGADMSYSFVDDQEATVHNAPTQVDTAVFTTVDVVWPFVLVTCNSGTGRVALV